MPKKTFGNISEEKQERIKKAILKEFLMVPLEGASIKNIVNDAAIPRGSFYQYFEDKEDALIYTIRNEMIYMVNRINHLETEDIFHLMEKVFLIEVENLRNSEDSNRAALLMQIAKSERAKQLFSETIIGYFYEMKWLANQFETICKDEVYRLTLMEMSISALQSSILSAFVLHHDVTVIHESLKRKLEILRKGIKAVELVR